MRSLGTRATKTRKEIATMRKAILASGLREAHREIREKRHEARREVNQSYWGW